MICPKKTAYISLLTLLVFSGFLFLSGCSGKPSESPDDRNMEPSQDSASDIKPKTKSTSESTNADDTWEEAAPSLVDNGTSCQNHSYQMMPGSTETLEFEKMLRNKPSDMSIYLELDRDTLSDLGIDISILGTDIETHTASYPVWAVDLSDSEQYRASLERGGHLTALSTEGRGLKGITGVKHIQDTYYVISAIDGRSWDKYQISKLSWDEVNELLDGDMEFHHTDPRTKETESYPVVQIDVDEEFYIVRMSANVNISGKEWLPDKINGEQNWYRSPQIGFDIRCVYDKNRRPYVTIEGPAYSPDCFRPW
ncbi:MAG: hypothetical protein JW755_03410 [Candidatus Aminicenantes bacterium]|nr:hypothetical protein [Candidatus Aminicenantes bacterium]